MSIVVDFLGDVVAWVTAYWLLKGIYWGFGYSLQVSVDVRRRS